MEDVKLQRMTKAQLVEALEHYQYREALFEATWHIAHIGYYEWSYDHDRLEYCSEEYARIFGMSVEETLDLQNSWEKVIQLIHADDRERYAKAYHSLPDKQSLDIEYRIFRKDGKIRLIREISIVVNDETGKLSGAFGIFQDITELKKYEKDLGYRDAMTRQAETVTDIGHFVYNLQTDKYIYISPGFARIHGVSCEEYMESVNSREDDIADVHPADYENLAEIYARHARDGNDYQVEYRIRRADGEIRWIREQSTARRVSDGVIQESLGVLQDVTDYKKTEAKLLGAKDILEATVKQRTQELADTVSQLQEEIAEREKISTELKFFANHDALTGLPSLRLCKDRLDRSLAESRRYKQMSAVMFVDLDGFKEVNDSYGHECGDAVLKVTADRIKAEIRETDTVARIGGDEFLVILSQISDMADTRRVAENIIGQISQIIVVDQDEMSVSASLGISIYPDDGTTSEELIRQADKAMYLVKHSGKNNYGYTRSSTLN